MKITNKYITAFASDAKATGFLEIVSDFLTAELVILRSCFSETSSKRCNFEQQRCLHASPTLGFNLDLSAVSNQVSAAQITPVRRFSFRRLRVSFTSHVESAIFN